MAENLLLKQQLIVLRRTRKRAPNLCISNWEFSRPIKDLARLRGARCLTWAHPVAAEIERVTRPNPLIDELTSGAAAVGTAINMALTELVMNRGLGWRTTSRSCLRTNPSRPGRANLAICAHR
jgi:hypothetical protein